MQKYEKKLDENKDIILRNIAQGKESGVNKVSAVFAITKDDDFRGSMITDLATWLLNDGYKVSVKDGDLQVLTIEWE